MLLEKVFYQNCDLTIKTTVFCVNYIYDGCGPKPGNVLSCVWKLNIQKPLMCKGITQYKYIGLSDFPFSNKLLLDYYKQSIILKIYVLLYFRISYVFSAFLLPTKMLVLPKPWVIPGDFIIKTWRKILFSKKLADLW